MVSGRQALRRRGTEKGLLPAVVVTTLFPAGAGFVRGIIFGRCKPRPVTVARVLNRLEKVDPTGGLMPGLHGRRIVMLDMH
jgi:hypothetical protein